MTPGKDTPLQVVVIDTDSGFLQVLAKRMDGLDWQYRITGGPLPVDALVALRLDALIIDLSVVGHQAWSYLEAVATKLPALGIVVVTGRASVSQRVRGLRLGADDWVAKPCHPEELIARVEAVVRRRRFADGDAAGAPVEAGELEVRPDQFQAFVRGESRRPHPARVRAAAAARRRGGPGAPARGHLPARLGLRDGPRRPLRRRVRAQAALRSSSAPRRTGATSTPTSASATASTPWSRTRPRRRRRRRLAPVPRRTFPSTPKLGGRCRPPATSRSSWASRPW